MKVKNWTGQSFIVERLSEVFLKSNKISRDLQNGRRLYDIEGLPDEGALWGDDEKVPLASFNDFVIMYFEFCILLRISTFLH